MYIHMYTRFAGLSAAIKSLRLSPYGLSFMGLFCTLHIRYLVLYCVLRASTSIAANRQLRVESCNVTTEIARFVGKCSKFLHPLPVLALSNSRTQARSHVSSRLSFAGDGVFILVIPSVRVTAAVTRQEIKSNKRQTAHVD